MPRRRPAKVLPPWRQRVVGGFQLGAVVFGGPWLIIVVLLVFGGRFQWLRRQEVDMLVLAAVYPLGPAIAGALLGLTLPHLRRPWAAVVAGIAASIPWFALLSMAYDPHGWRPYSVSWPVVLPVAFLLGPIVGATAYDVIPMFRRRPKRPPLRAADVGDGNA